MFLDFLKTNIVPYYLVNTGTIFDIATGIFKPSTTGGWLLDGGLSQTLGIMGRGQTYKSNLAGSLIARALEIHPQATAYIYETEGTVSGAERYDQFVDTKVSDRILFCNNTTDDLTSFYRNFNQIIEAKEAAKKELFVESPFLDKNTGKPAKIWIPTFILVDSYSRASCAKADEAITENDIDSSAMNAWYMTNNNAKTKMLSDFVMKASKYGIYGIFTAHIGDKIDMNAYAPTPKQMQFMKMTDKLKNVGSNFTFLTSCLVQTLKATVRTNTAKKCEYPRNSNSKLDIEVNEIETRFVRSKNNVSGTSIFYLVSQYQGILDSVTNFEFLRNNKNYGLTVKGNNTSFSSLFNPQDNFTKISLRQDSHDKYELKRGLELIAQLCYVQNNWDTDNLPPCINTSIETVAELLYQCEAPVINRILNSTGVWSTSKLERERLTLLDVMLLIEKEAKNKKLATSAKS